MRKNLRVSLRRGFFLFLFAALFFAASFLPAQEPPSDEVALYDTSYDETAPSLGSVRWYRSDAAGMALEYIPSRLVALRNEYCLSIERVHPSELPVLLFPYLNEPYRVEKRTLYEKREESRRQWIFRDAKGLARLVSSGSTAFWDGTTDGDNDDEEKSSGFIEFRNSEGLIYRELRFEENSSEWEFLFFYDEDVLLRAETWFKEAPGGTTEENAVDADSADSADSTDSMQEPPPAAAEPFFIQVSTDYYLYSRIGALRSINRLLHEGANLSRITFPRIGAGFSSGDDMMAYGIAHNSRFLSDIHGRDSVKISYNLDSRGRILGEVWKNDDEEVLGEFINSWSGDRLVSILWKSPDEERLVEYEYDGEGNRILERNFNRGVLERRVTSRGDLDTEEIYFDGNLILRAVWDKGVRIFEERFSFGDGGRP